MRRIIRWLSTLSLASLGLAFPGLPGCASAPLPSPTPVASSSPTPLPPLKVCARDAALPAGASLSISGRMHTISGFPSSALGNTRSVRIWLPAAYETESSRTFPVLYMHDGQNLFASTSGGSPVKWEVDGTTDALIAAGKLEDLIIVGIDNTGARMDEYTPTQDSAGRGGKGDAYARFVINEVKPYIDSAYRTQCEPESTAVAGSSLGGLISFYMGVTYPEIFGQVAAVSPSFWWDDQETLRALSAQSTPPTPRFWIDMGTGEGSDDEGNGLTSSVEDARAVRDRLLTLGLPFVEQVGYLEVPGGVHNEAAWAERFSDILLFLFGKDADATPESLTLLPYGAEVGVNGLNRIPAVTQVAWPAGLRMTVPASLTTLTALTPTIATIDSQSWITGVSPGNASFRSAWSSLTADASLPVLETVSTTATLTMDVTVPDNTPSTATIYVSGNLEEVGGWDPGAVSLSKVDTTLWRFLLTLNRNSQVEFKFTRGSWATVEKDATCAEITNRVETADQDRTIPLTVVKWADLCN